MVIETGELQIARQRQPGGSGAASDRHTAAPWRTHRVRAAARLGHGEGEGPASTALTGTRTRAEGLPSYFDKIPASCRM
ncbi:unnamed protein product [Pleuronectes platessa]|uniref:Uncharacterized protein n=1 Tax=Pleuronectes platessa TaxID=8262 RepID=A0A9N7YPL2_PLEPL|nr:unnamed protein product [Pleuronectes platessa]